MNMHDERMITHYQHLLEILEILCDHACLYILKNQENLAHSLIIRDQRVNHA